MWEGTETAGKDEVNDLCFLEEVPLMSGTQCRGLIL